MEYTISNKTGIVLYFISSCIINLFSILLMVLVEVKTISDIIQFIVFILMVLVINLLLFNTFYLQHGVSNIYSIKIDKNRLEYTSLFRQRIIQLNDIKYIKNKRIQSNMGRYDIIIIKLKKGLPIYLSMQEVHFKDEVKIRKSIERELMPIEYVSKYKK